jgi:ABC-type transport system involved in multi-copper enzyme maturation permease subunit
MSDPRPAVPPPLPRRPPPPLPPKRRRWRFLSRFGNALLGWEVLRAGRRSGSLALGRVALGGLLLAAMWALYTASFDGAQAEMTGAGTEIGKRLNRFAEEFAVTFFVVQATAVLLLTPVFVAGAIFEERETRSGEILLTTELTRREVYVGKLGARMVQVLLVVLAGMPILFLTQLWGGVSMEMILVCYAATGLSVVGAGVVTAAVSAYAESMRAAILKSYALLFLIDGLFFPAGPYLVIISAAGHWAGGLAVLGVLFLPLQLTVVWVGYAIGQRWLRMAMLRQKRRLDDQPSRPPPLPGQKPHVGALPLTDHIDPLVWKELNSGGRVTLRDAARAVTGAGRATFEDRLETMGVVRWFAASREPMPFALRICTFLVAVLLAVLTIANLIPSDWVVRYFGGAAVAWLMCAVGLTAAGGIAKERQKQTLTDLLMLPGPRKDLLRAKALGALVRGLWPAVVLAAFVAVALPGLGVALLAVPMLVIAAVGFTLFAVGAGVWLSARCKNLVTANGAWIGVLSAVVIGSFLVAEASAERVEAPDKSKRIEYPAWTRVVNPLLAWGRLCFRYDYGRDEYVSGPMSEYPWPLQVKDVIPALACPLLYALIGGVAWLAAVRRFEREGRA